MYFETFKKVNIKFSKKKILSQSTIKQLFKKITINYSCIIMITIKLLVGMSILMGASILHYWNIFILFCITTEFSSSLEKKKNSHTMAECVNNWGQHNTTLERIKWTKYKELHTLERVKTVRYYTNRYRNDDPCPLTTINYKALDAYVEQNIILAWRGAFKQQHN